MAWEGEKIMEKNKFMKLNIQLFAETTPSPEGVSDNGAENIDGTPLTFDEILSDKEYQREFDKRVAKAIETSKSKWQKETEAQKTEAEKLAKMDAEQKHQYELEKAEAEKKEALARLNAYELKEQALKIASDKELDISLLEIIDYSKENADSVKTKIDNIDTVFKKAVEKKVNEKLQETSPRQVRNGSTSVDKDYLKNKYGKNPFYKG